MAEDQGGPVDAGGAEGLVRCSQGHRGDAAQEFCSACGTALWTTCPDGHRTLAANRYCEHCGQALQEHSRRRRWLVAIAAAAVLAAAAGAVIVVTSGGGDEGTPVATGDESSTTDPDGAAATGPADDDLDEDQVVLGPFGLDVADIGDNGDAAIDAVTAVFGPPTVNDPGEYDPCVGGTVSFPQWDDLTLVVITTDLPRFAGYGYGTVEEIPTEPGALVTAEGITIGSSEADLRDAYPDVEVFYDEFVGATVFRVGETDDFVRGLRGELVSAGGESVVAYVAAGHSGYCD